MEDFFDEMANRPRPNLFRRIYLWWEFDGKYIVSNFKTGIIKLWYWFPIIWKDRDWDGHYIFEVLKHKINAQAKYIGDRNFHTDAPLDARRMKLCVKLIQLIQDETYSMEYMGYHKNKTWFVPCDDGTGNSLMESKQVWENFDEYIEKYPLIYKRVMNGDGMFTLDGRDEEHIKKIVAMNIAHINHDRARKLLFKIMEENIEKWWD